MGVVISARESLYTVTGGTAEDIAASMALGGPRVLGQRRFGATAWRIEWKYAANASGAGCRPGTVTVSLWIEVTLPHWQAPQNAPPPLVAAWNRFVGALRSHELAHAALARDAAADVARVLRAARGDKCVAQANASAYQVLEQYRDRERRLDARTRHGARDGVVWPQTDRHVEPSAKSTRARRRGVA